MSENKNSIDNGGNYNSHGNHESHGNYASDGNNYSRGNYASNGNNYSRGNYASNGNYYSHGNYDSHGNSASNGNYGSDGNYWSDGNCHSNANYWSFGNYWSDGNCQSRGNYYSQSSANCYFLFNCKGSCYCIFCKDINGNYFKIFNQQCTQNQFDDFKSNLFKILQNWIPYTITFRERQNDEWHKSYHKDNLYVQPYKSKSGSIEPIEIYHDAWARCPYKKELIQLIKKTDYLHTKKSLEIFEEITGINEEISESIIEIKGKKYKLLEEE